MKRKLKKILPNNVKPKITYTRRKLGSLFQIKDQTIFEQKHDVIYHGKCPAENCVDDTLEKQLVELMKELLAIEVETRILIY